jgi:small nuclear ribonucleoprotein (snRNP)-like protein
MTFDRTIGTRTESTSATTVYAYHMFVHAFYKCTAVLLFIIVTMSGNIGVPIKLLYEAEGMKISVEMKNGEIYRGLLLGAEDTMNVSLSDVLRTARNGQISKLSNVYLRGSSIRFIALPDLLKSAPIFQKVQTQKRKLEEAMAQRQGGTKKRKINK